MRKLAISAALSAALTGAALLVGANPAAAWTPVAWCDTDLHNNTYYGHLNAEVTWSPDDSVERTFSMYSSNGNPIKSESFVRLFFSDGHTKDYRYTEINDESDGSLRYSNPVDHPGVTKLMFHTYIGPDDNVWGCEEWKYRP
jgi:hypothetical protein